MDDFVVFSSRTKGFSCARWINRSSMKCLLARFERITHSVIRYSLCSSRRWRDEPPTRDYPLGKTASSSVARIQRPPQETLNANNSIWRLADDLIKSTSTRRWIDSCQIHDHRFPVFNYCNERVALTISVINFKCARLSILIIIDDFMA